MRGERGKMPVVSIAYFEPRVHGSSIKCALMSVRPIHIVCRLLLFYNTGFD
jgi:hypothetical protein